MRRRSTKKVNAEHARLLEGFMSGHLNGSNRSSTNTPTKLHMRSHSSKIESPRHNRGGSKNGSRDRRQLSVGDPGAFGSLGGRNRSGSTAPAGHDEILAAAVARKASRKAKGRSHTDGFHKQRIAEDDDKPVVASFTGFSRPSSTSPLPFTSKKKPSKQKYGRASFSSLSTALSPKRSARTVPKYGSLRLPLTQSSLKAIAPPPPTVTRPDCACGKPMFGKRFCIQCGGLKPQGPKTCKGCGFHHNGKHFCTECGASVLR